MIRQANKSDLQAVIRLLKLALDDIIYHLSGTKDELQTDNKLQELFLSKQSRISYKNITIFEENGVVAGIMVSYDGSKLNWLDEHFKGVFERECFDDEYYIDAIAVDENFRNKGIATKLINQTKNLAKMANQAKISLIVDINKPKNVALYEKLGFKTDQILKIYNHEYKHMIKDTLMRNFEVNGINCVNCANSIKNALSDEFGEIVVDLEKNPRVVSLNIDDKDLQKFTDELDDLGFKLIREI